MPSMTAMNSPPCDDLAVARSIKRRSIAGRGAMVAQRMLQVGCSMATWSMSGPATLGGDVADSFTLPDDWFVVAVWDAAGHGNVAAPDATFVRMGLRALLGVNPDIAGAMFALNAELFRRARTLLPWPFVSGFFGLVNPRSRTLRYISCGHETALLFRGPRAHVHLPHNSPILGISEAAELTVDAIRVARGDRLVVVSNGVTNARPLCSQTEFFGTARLCSLVRSQFSEGVVDASRLIDHVVGFADGALDDDAAALIAQFD